MHSYQILFRLTLKSIFEYHLVDNFDNLVNTVKTSLKCAAIKNGQSLQWSESISIPIEQSKQIMFEIYESHEFGYNPEELEGVLGGKIVFDTIQTAKGGWDIKDNQKQTVGFLQATINRTNADEIELVQDLQEAVEENFEFSNGMRTISIRSIALKLISSKSIKKGVVQLEIGGKKVRSSELKHRNGSLVCLRLDSLNFEESKKQGTITLLELANGQEVVVGKASLELSANGSFQRLNLMNSGMKVGIVIIESSIIDRVHKNVSEMIHTRESVLGHSSVLKRYVNSQIKRNELQADGASMESRLSRISRISDPFQMSKRSKKYGRQSVIGNNANIIFSRQKRFSDFQDKANPRVSYLNNYDMQFRSASSGKFYRGAGFGFGSKTDFTLEGRKNPGVGDYRLPTIWDKY